MSPLTLTGPLAAPFHPEDKKNPKRDLSRKLRENGVRLQVMISATGWEHKHEKGCAVYSFLSFSLIISLHLHFALCPTLYFTGQHFTLPTLQNFSDSALDRNHLQPSAFTLMLCAYNHIQLFPCQILALKHNLEENRHEGETVSLRLYGIHRVIWVLCSSGPQGENSPELSAQDLGPLSCSLDFTK